ncbi:phospholipid/cholesterol/gamma-HCH transport system substrate-binding protein [Saccharopolyspora erythraea NRRL 2338]|uniref:MCE family protein n=2 Tax=Saccharopolyspora erythraea TaxID=1836 RepID=A4FPP8_SACEN|nr:MCE family protein [Saccharopolyspora erythraea]EQD86908.1 ABC transporter substrate-binding protein [Saccharopolyspora erythraea D]PFG99668.1 phospholipid/cholesterol/gamma-HCH transport system substrate-binding protein [Saccharopolyspora erythraea NRRL 2338]QRK89555.1 MCE family protein [Saccharopolyspora erythraea]CAM06023.1 MCE family protein [Saccharopolyspora erythraea NRRL 2338]
MARRRGTLRRSAVVRLAALGAAALVLISGCGFRGVDSMPLPGGADVGSDPYTVKVRFQDVLDLVPNAGVRVNDVPVGRVSEIGLAADSWQAEVTVLVNGDVKLPANATARLRQSSLLGEKYVELGQPAEPVQPVGRLVDGDVIDLARTSRNPEVEEVLGAMSMLLNGGGVAQLQNITKELNAALEGRESDVRSLLSNVDQLVAGLDAQRDDITRALDSVNRLSASLNAQRGNIDTALRDIEPGLRVLNEQRGQLVTMLQSLDKLSGVATNVVNQSKDDLVHNVNQLAPTLRELAAAGEDLPKSLEVLLTFPFPDNAVEGIKGSDYTNLYVNVDLNLSNILDNLGRSRQPLIHPPNGLPPLPLPGLAPEQPAPESSPTTQPQPRPEPEKESGSWWENLFGGGDR